MFVLLKGDKEQGISQLVHQTMPKSTL